MLRWFEVIVAFIAIIPGLTIADHNLQFANELEPRQTQNIFTNPSGDPSDLDFSNNPVFEVDTTVDLQWTLDSSITEDLSLFLSVGINTSFAPTPQAIERKISGDSFEWNAVNAFGVLSQMFKLQMRVAATNAILFESHVFNISETPLNVPDVQSDVIDIALSSSTETPEVTLTTSTSIIVQSTSVSIVVVPQIASATTSAFSGTTSSPDSSLTASSARPGSTLSLTGDSPSIFTTKTIPSSSSGTFPSPATTFISRASTATTSIAPASSDSSSKNNANVVKGQKRTENALGAILAIFVASVAGFYIWRYTKSHPQFLSLGFLSILTRRTSPAPKEDAESKPKKLVFELESGRRILPAELEGVPIEPAELDGGPRSPVELDGGTPRPKSVVSKWSISIRKSMTCPWSRFK